MLEEFYPEARRGNHFGSIIRYIELLQGLHLIVPPLFQLSSIAFLKTVVQNTSQGRCCDELDEMSFTGMGFTCLVPR